MAELCEAQRADLQPGCQRGRAGFAVQFHAAVRHSARQSELMTTFLAEPMEVFGVE